MIIEGLLVNHDGERDGRIEIDPKTGLIVNVGPRRGDSSVDARGCLIFPGFGDLHVHAREDASGTQSYKEDFRTMSEAALNGGVTHVAEMPNNPVAPVDDARYHEKQKLAEKSLVDVTLYAGIGPKTEPLSFPVPYKVFMGPSVGDLFFTSQSELEEKIKKYRGENISFHCEDPELLATSKSAATHEARRPPEAEALATDFALSLIETYGLQGKLCHYSTNGGLQKVADAKKRGLSVTAEVTPHHLYFDDTMLNDTNRLSLQMNPPIRSRDDRMAMIEGLKNGALDYLATDHAPHTREEKLKGTSGVPHLDTYGPFVTWLITKHTFTPETIARVCSWNPGQFVQPYLPKTHGKGFGKIEEGYVGSLTIIDPSKPVTITQAMLKTKCGWSPFEGVTFPGSVRYTVLRGKMYGQP